jgi:ABC-type multidrug transport system ATPase subunit
MVADALVSRVHATVVPTGAGLEIHDNSGGNGTFVNGERIDRVLLREGDVVTVGNADFTVSDTTLAPRPAPDTGGLRAHRLRLIVNGQQVLTDVSFTARPGTLTAVIGPAGAGKSSLVTMLCGLTRPSRGLVLLDGHNVHAEYAAVRSRIGLVPQDDAIHYRLTVEQALGYAAELRLPADTSPAERHQVVSHVLDELELTPCRTTRIDGLSGAQRKRVSVAMELLTGPALLIFDEPTFGLGQSLGEQMMTMARQLADAGRVVVAVPHSRECLHLCEQAVVLTSRGKTAFVGPPDQISAVTGATRWADILVGVSTDDAGDAPLPAQQTSADSPQAAERREPVAPARAGQRRQSPSVARRQVQTPPMPPSDRKPGSAARTSRRHQISAVARRQFRLIGADRSYCALLAVLPFILGALSLAVFNLGRADPHSEGSEILSMLNVAAVLMGTTLSIGELVRERSVFRREQSVGLSASAYLAAKILVFGVAAIVETAILVAIVVASIGVPADGAVGHPIKPIAELYLIVATTAVVSTIVGLGMSSLAKHRRRILSTFVTAILISFLLCEGTIPLTDRIVRNQNSSAPASRASHIGFRAADLFAAQDRLGTHSMRWLVFNMALLGLFAAMSAGFVRWRLRPPSRK